MIRTVGRGAERMVGAIRVLRSGGMVGPGKRLAGTARPTRIGRAAKKVHFREVARLDSGDGNEEFPAREWMHDRRSIDFGVADRLRFDGKRDAVLELLGGKGLGRSGSVRRRLLEAAGDGLRLGFAEERVGELRAGGLAGRALRGSEGDARLPLDVRQSDADPAADAVGAGE